MDYNNMCITLEIAYALSSRIHYKVNFSFDGKSDDGFFQGV